MNYNYYHSEDFAADETFIAYYHQTDESAIAFWRDWIAHHPEKLDEIYNAERILCKLSFRLDEEELQNAFAKFDDFLSKDDISNLPPTSEKVIKLKSLKWAITVVLLIGLSLGGYHFYEIKFNDIEYVTRQNGNGKISQFILTDGTKISLNCNSAVTYAKVFKGDKREVKLDGEAFFEVAKDKTKPFTVIANGIKTTVLGTKFNVSAYKNLKQISVALVEGKVEVQTTEGRDKLILQPSEMATFDIKAGILSRSIANALSISSWKDGNIVFEGANFEDIATKLHNIYGINLLDQTKNLKWNYSGNFEKADYLTIIKSICFAKKITYKQTKDTIILTN
jgi:ferric-dicitrate binding protein FerR (iron transport regulator)